MNGEVPVHFLEFAFEIVSAPIAFWFCGHTKAVTDREIGQTLIFGDGNSREVSAAPDQHTQPTPQPTPTQIEQQQHIGV